MERERPDRADTGNNAPMGDLSQEDEKKVLLPDSPHLLSAEEKQPHPLEEEILEINLTPGSPQDILIREFGLRPPDNAYTKFEAYERLGLDVNNPEDVAVFKKTMRSLGGKTNTPKSRIEIVRFNRKYGNDYIARRKRKMGMTEVIDEEIPYSPKNNFDELMALEPGERKKHSVTPKNTTPLSMTKMKKRDSQLRLKLNQGYNEFIGLDSIRLILKDLTPASFQDMTGDPYDVLETIVGEETMEDYLLIKAVNPAREASLDEIFWQQFTGAVEQLWDSTIPHSQLAAAQTKNPKMFSAHEILQDLKKAGWSKEQIKSIIKKHFSLQVEERDEDNAS